MRLKEPLEGLKSVAEGNLVVYLSFFVTSFFIHDLMYGAKDQGLFTESEELEQDMYFVLRIGHIVAIAFKVFEYATNNLSCFTGGIYTKAQTGQSFLSLVIFYLGYLLPLFLCIYARQNRTYIEVRASENIYEANATPYSVFLFIVTGAFFSMIIAGSLFTLIVYAFKLKQDSPNQEDEDPWQMKDARDFLEYIHDEFKDFSRQGGFMFMSIFELYTHITFYGIDGTDKMQDIMGTVLLSILILIRFAALQDIWKRCREGEQYGGRSRVLLII